MLTEERRTPIPRLEAWLRRACRCPEPPSCSSRLSRLFNEAVASGRRAKPKSHFDAEAQRWRIFEERAALRVLHQSTTSGTAWRRGRRGWSERRGSGKTAPIWGYGASVAMTKMGGFGSVATERLGRRETLGPGGRSATLVDLPPVEAG